MITRLIIVRVPEAKMAEAERTWKEVCGTKMIRVKGCLSEQLLRCREAPGEYISMAAWDSAASIEAYRESRPHQEIRQATRGLTIEPVVVKTYEVVG
jgi:heme-degrading monooxygenase HmoA